MDKNKSIIVTLGSVAHLNFKLLSRKDFNWPEVRFTSLGMTYELRQVKYQILIIMKQLRRLQQVYIY